MAWSVHEGMGWWMLFGGALWLVFWVSLIYLLVSGFTDRRRADRALPADEPDDIARRRYARGEISRGEFEQIRRDLQATS